MIRTIFVMSYRLGIRLLGGRGLSRTPFLGRVHRYLSLQARTYRAPDSIQAFGNVIYLPRRDDLALGIWGPERYEPEIVTLLRQRLRPGDVFVDIGANIGFFTLLAAQLVGPGGRVFAFEPHPGNMALLRKNVAANGYRNVTLEAKAGNDRGGTVPLFVSNYNMGDHCIYDRGEKIKEFSVQGDLNRDSAYDQHDGDEPRASLDVPAVTLDDYFRDVPGPVSFVKIDVQGAEALVAAGMKDLLRRNPQATVVCEFWPAGIKMTGHEPEAFLRSFEEDGFRISEIEEGSGALRPATAAELAAKYNPRNNKGCNLVFARPQ